MKKLVSLLMAFSLALVPMLSFADESSGATQNIYNMLLEELTAANLSMTPYDDINRIYLGYMLEKNALGNAVVIFDAYSDGFIIGVGYDKPIDEALVPQVISLFNDINCAVYVGKMVSVSPATGGIRRTKSLCRRIRMISAHGRAKTCWRTCIWRWTRWRKWSTTSPNWQTAKPLKTCLLCGMPIRQRNDRKNPLHVALTHAIMEETWRISPEMRVFLMKKLFSLLLVLALALVPTLSLADDDAAYQNIYNMLLDELKSVDLEMTADEESYRIYLGSVLDKNSLGDADVIFDAYSDAVTINVSYSNPLDEALVPQVISFFNRVNSTLYVGKLMVIKSDSAWYAAYEIFLSVDPENITDWDRNNVLAYTAMALDTMEEMVDYITEIANGESADNVFAMWQADIGTV